MLKSPRNVGFGIVLLVALAGRIGDAQEAPVVDAPPAEAGSLADSDTTYYDLRRSKDRTTRQWAERYFNLTKLQEWSSAKGKKVKAKYVAHAEDLSSVTLAVAQGKEVRVPVAQLDKSCQSRVKQIAVTQKKLDELIAEGAKGEPGKAGETAASDPGAPMVDEIGAQPPRRQPPARRPPRRAVGAANVERAATSPAPEAPPTTGAVARGAPVASAP